MDKDNALKIIVTCAKIYKENLLNKNVLFVYGSLANINYIETLFLQRHFLHLTGVHVQSKRLSSTEFFSMSINNRLRTSDFELPKDGTADLKLAILPALMIIHKTAKMIGEYDNSKTLLFTAKIIGNVTACIGFVPENRFYVPNTALKEDIRNVTSLPQLRILASYRKNVKDTNYHDLCYIAKGINSSDLPFSRLL